MFRLIRLLPWCLITAVSGFSMISTPPIMTKKLQKSMSRRRLMAVLPLCFLVQPSPTLATKGRSLSPDEAYLNLRAAREELAVAGRTYFPKRDMVGLRTFLQNEAVQINNFEENVQVLLESKRLDAESKKEIGTIRRYGVGADVIIMFGGLLSELQEDYPRYGEVEKYFVRTLDSIEEVIAICRSNGFKQT